MTETKKFEAPFRMVASQAPDKPSLTLLFVQENWKIAKIECIQAVAVLFPIGYRKFVITDAHGTVIDESKPL